MSGIWARPGVAPASGPSTTSSRRSDVRGSARARVDLRGCSAHGRVSPRRLDRPRLRRGGRAFGAWPARVRNFPRGVSELRVRPSAAPGAWTVTTSSRPSGVGGLARTCAGFDFSAGFAGGVRPIGRPRIPFLPFPSQPFPLLWPWVPPARFAASDTHGVESRPVGSAHGVRQGAYTGTRS